MAFGIKGLFRNFLNDPIEALDAVKLDELQTETAIREICFWHCVKLVSAAVNNCEFKTYVDRKVVKQDQYYIWNVSPNVNQTAAEFKNELIAKLFSENEVLIFSRGYELFVADSFIKKQTGISEAVFESVVYKTEQIAPIRMRDAIYVALADNNVGDVVKRIYENHKKLIAAGRESFIKLSGQRAIMSIDAARQGDEEKQKESDAKLKVALRDFFTGTNTVFRQYRGQDLQLQKNEVKPDSREYRALINDLMALTADAFCIPAKLATGEVENTEEAVDQFLTFCVDHVNELIEQAVNKGSYSKQGYLRGTRLKIDSSSVKHVDLLETGTSVEKLLGSGVLCINDIRIYLGLEPISEPWAEQHFITRNFETIEEALRNLGAGGKQVSDAKKIIGILNGLINKNTKKGGNT